MAVLFVDLLCVFSVLCLLCLCARLFKCALWSSAGKGLASWLSLWCLTVSLSLSYWYPGPGVVLDCIDSWYLHPYLLLDQWYNLGVKGHSQIYLKAIVWLNTRTTLTLFDWGCSNLAHWLPMVRKFQRLSNHRYDLETKGQVQIFLKSVYSL